MADFPSDEAVQRFRLSPFVKLDPERALRRAFAVDEPKIRADERQRFLDIILGPGLEDEIRADERERVLNLREGVTAEIRADERRRIVEALREKAKELAWASDEQAQDCKALADFIERMGEEADRG